MQELVEMPQNKFCFSRIYESLRLIRSKTLKADLKSFLSSSFKTKFAGAINFNGSIFSVPARVEIVESLTSETSRFSISFIVDIETPDIFESLFCERPFCSR